MVISIDLISIRYCIDERERWGKREKNGIFLNGDFRFDFIKFLKWLELKKENEI